MKANKKSAARSDRCGDTSDREIIHRDVSLDTRFISLPLFHLSSGLCLYSAWVCVCCRLLPLYTHSHTHTSTSQTCPCATFLPHHRQLVRLIGVGGGEKEKKTPPALEPNPITRNRM